MPQVKRLDIILLELNLITEEQIKETLERQKLQGGKFGTNLLYNKFVSETDLIRALSIQFDIPGVILSEINISKETLELIPTKGAIARKIIPFDYDSKTHKLKIAVSNPGKINLSDELDFVARGEETQLYVASALSIDAALGRYYVSAGESKESASADLTNEIERNLKKLNSQNRTVQGRDVVDQIILVTDENSSAPMVKTIIENSGSHMDIVDSLDKARKLLKTRNADLILIKEDLCDDKRKAESALRTINYRTAIKWFNNLSELIYNGPRTDSKVDPIHTLESLLSLLSTNYGEAFSPSVLIGRYTSRICSKLRLQDSQSEKIIVAGYMSHLALYNSAIRGIRDGWPIQEIIRESTALLRSIGYDRDVLEILGNTYENIKTIKSASKSNTVAIGSNIVTMACSFFESLKSQNSLSLSELEEIKQTFAKETGVKLLPEVVDTLISILQEECLDNELGPTKGEVAIFISSEHNYDPLITHHLSSNGLRITTSYSISDFVQVCRRRCPDVIILFGSKNVKKTRGFIDELKSNGIDIQDIPTILISSNDWVGHREEMYKAGIYDLVSLPLNYEVLCTKVLTAIDLRDQGKLEEDDEKVAARGHLADINLIDLIQALGPGRKTVSIDLTNNGSNLQVVLKQGAIVYARMDDVFGPEAVYKGVTWRDGDFTVYIIEESEIPEANIDLPNESILMEGCRLIDEEQR